MGSLINMTIIFFSVVVTLFLFIGLPVLLSVINHSPKNPIFIVESSTVQAYNLTSDNQLFCIINLSVRVQNPNPKKTSYRIGGVDMEVRKGKHHKLADDALPSVTVGPGRESLVRVEAVGLHVGLKRKIAEEVKADVAARDGRVNVFMTGFVSGDYLDVACKNVAVDFSRSTVKVQNVKCKVTVTVPSD